MEIREKCKVEVRDWERMLFQCYLNVSSSAAVTGFIFLKLIVLERELILKYFKAIKIFNHNEKTDYVTRDARRESA